MLRIDVVTLFEPMFDAVGRHGITGRALDRGLWSLRCWNPRSFAVDAYRTVDDRPYGGGPGMVMMAEPLASAFDAIAADRLSHGLAREACGPTICLSPQGAPVTHRRMQALAREQAVTLLCGRYEGIDQRLLDSRVDEELAIGDFVVSGGELPAMMLIDAAVRLLPGAMNDATSVEQDSFATGLLDCPHYTRPEDFDGRPVPPVLLSGHHAKIARWRRDRALEATWRRRPALIDQARADGLLDKADEAFLAALRG